MTRNEAIKFVILRSIGNFLVLFAIFGILATFGPALYYEVSFKISQARGVKYSVPVTHTALGDILDKEAASASANSGSVSNLASVLTGPTEQILVPSDTQFSILIPKIGANSKIIPNVDASNESVFLPALKEGVAHAKGTVFPGTPGITYLFAHSTDNFWDVGRYNAVFYLLKDLSPGDDVIIFYNNVRYNYVVTDSKTVDPSDTSFLQNSHQGPEQLVLQTCWPPGTTWKRLLVFAKRK